jgi:hypothetical protein
VAQAPVALLALADVEADLDSHAALRLGKQRAHEPDPAVAVAVDGPRKQGQSEDAGHSIHLLLVRQAIVGPVRTEVSAIAHVRGRGVHSAPAFRWTKPVELLQQVMAVCELHGDWSTSEPRPAASAVRSPVYINCAPLIALRLRQSVRIHVLHTRAVFNSSRI